MRRFNRKSRIFISWLFTYCIVLIVAFISVFVTYHITKSMIVNENYKNNRLLMDVVQSESDRMFDAMEKTAIGVGQDEQVKKMAQTAVYLDRSVRYELGSISLKLNTYADITGRANEFYLYFSALDMAATLNGNSDNIDLYNNLNLDITYDEWKNIITTDSGNRLIDVKTKNGESLFLYVIKSYYTREYNIPNVSLIYILDKNDFAFISDNKIADMNFYLKKSATENIPIFESFSVDEKYLKTELSDGIFEKLGGEYLYSAASSNLWQMQYIILSREDIVFAGLDKMHNVYLFISLIALIIGVFLAWYFASSNYNSIKKISDSVSLYLSEDDDVSTLKGLSEFTVNMVKNYVKVVNDNTSKQEKIKRELIRTLLHSNYASQEELLKKIASDKIEFYSDKFAVLIVQLNSDVSMFMNYNMFVKLIVDVCSLKHDATVLDENGFLVCLINFNEGLDTESMRRDVVEMKNSICNMTKNGKAVDMKFASSKIITGANNIYLGFTEAMAVMDYKTMSQSKDVFFFEDIKEYVENTGEYYTLSQEKSFINAITVGRSDLAQTTMAQVIKTMLTDSNMMRLGSKYLIYDIVSSMMKAASQIGSHAVKFMLENNLALDAEIKKPHSAEEYIELLNPIVEKLCSFTEHEKPGGKSLEELVMKNIYDNYTDYNLCLNSIANELGFHPVYLSSSFKSQYGEGISTRIERIRLEKAYELLTQGESVSSVAEKVGYGNTQTFSKAFKRKYGVTPSVIAKLD